MINQVDLATPMESIQNQKPFSLPRRDERYLSNKNIRYDLLTGENNEKIIIFKQVPLPPHKFNFTTADVLVILPDGYPDCPTDMFYTDPWLKLSGTNAYPKAADQSYSLNGKSWQRWSRHNNQWRPGIDGIKTIWQRIQYALKEAQ